MSSAVQLGAAQLLPIKEAAEFVPYSRDYVARLAREGKVVAVQIDRQWFVDVTSLQNFFAHATIEESVRKRHLSTKRKRDLEVKEVYETRLLAIAEKRQSLHRAAVMHTSFILVCGLATGLLFTVANQYSDKNHLQSLAQVSSYFAHTAPAPRVVLSVPAVTTQLDTDQSVQVTDQKFDVRQGIVVVPHSSTSATTSVTDFFSDPVQVEMTGETSGTIHNQTTHESLPFVRVPSGARVATSSKDRNDVTP